MTCAKAYLWDGTMPLSPGLALDVLPPPLFSCSAPSSSCMNFPGLLKNVFKLSPRDWETTQLWGHCEHERHRLSVKGLHICMVPKTSVAQETCEGQTQAFKESNQKKLHFQVQMLQTSFIPPDIGT